MIVHIDARKLTDSAGLHAALSEAFGRRCGQSWAVPG